MTISTNTTRAEVTIEEDKETGDLMIPIPEEFIRHLGWDINDELDLVENADGSFTLTKISR